MSDVIDIIAAINLGRCRHDVTINVNFRNLDYTLGTQSKSSNNSSFSHNGPPRLSICHQRAVHKRKKS